MAYEDLTDNDLNRKLAILLGEYHRNDFYPKYCKSFTRVLSLTIKHRIALFPFTDKSDTEWYADAIFLDEDWSVCLDKNPLRAAVIVLIGILESVKN